MELDPQPVNLMANAMVSREPFPGPSTLTLYSSLRGPASAITWVFRDAALFLSALGKELWNMSEKIGRGEKPFPWCGLRSGTFSVKTR